MSIQMKRNVYGHELRKGIDGCWHHRFGHFDVTIYRSEGFGPWFAKYRGAPGHFCRAKTLKDLVLDVSMHLEPDNRAV